MATFRQLNSGRWQARVSKEGEEFSIGTFRTKKEAQIEAGRVEERIYYGQTLNDRNMLFGEVSEEWLNEHKKASVKDPSFEQIEIMIRLHINPFFKNKRIMQIRRTDIKRWIDKYVDMKSKDGEPKYKHGTLTQYLSTLKSVFHYAIYELEILEKNPADKLMVPVQDKVAINRVVKYYSLVELNKLLDFMQDFKPQKFKEYRLYYMLMYFMSQSGLRISEALALKWTDLAGNKIIVERQTRRNNNNKVLITTLKNVSSYRTIKLNDETLEELELFKLKQREMILNEKRFKKNDEDIIFQNYLGNYLTPATVRDMIKRYCNMAGVDYKGTHGFRHTHAVLLLESGASIKFVADRLGHKTTKTTTDTYLDITEKIEEDELQKFSSYTSRKSESARNRHTHDSSPSKSPTKPTTTTF